MSSLQAEIIMKKDAVKAYQRAYYLANRTKILARSATNRATNLLRDRANQKAWREANKERCEAVDRLRREHNIGQKREYDKARYLSKAQKIKEMVVAWQKANPEKFKLYQKIHRARHPEAARARKISRRAREFGDAKSRITAADIRKLTAIQRGQCAMCRCKLSKSGWHVDHIMPLALGGKNTKRNIQLLCVTCNLRKGAKHPNDFSRRMGFLL
jgi:5-methylcytosine-specific restriction endonuclease McrA